MSCKQAIAILLGILLTNNVIQAAPATRPAEGKLPHLQVNLAKHQVRVECEAINAEEKLEFLVCATGTKEYESVLRSRARPSHLHLALLMLGLAPGQPVKFNEAENVWIPPRGPALKLSCEFVRDGKTTVIPASRLMRSVKDRTAMPDVHWVFVGAPTLDDGEYAADVTGYLITVVNFEHTVIDIPQLKSSKNESLEWEINPEVMPKRNTPIWLIIEPAKPPESQP
jgi:hypothetical protein